jgi:hypothetical protein
MQYAYAYQLNGTQAGGLDPDAKAYILAVEAADGQTLEAGVKNAYNTFVKGCKSDGIWNAIKASCIMAGARTLSGALVPLKGTAPTNFNFVSGDYNRKTGLVGNGLTKYLDSNRNNNSDPQNSKHIAVNIASAQVSLIGAYLGAGLLSAGDSVIGSNRTLGNFFYRVHSAAVNFTTGAASSVGFIGASRSSSADFIVRLNGANSTVIQASETPSNNSILVFARGAVADYATARMNFYSIGESLDLSKLDSRVDRLVAELAFNINTGLDGSIYDIDTLKYINAGYAAGGTLS